MTKFSDLELDPKVLKAIDEAGYETPTPIQAAAIPHALQGRDVLGIAQTGTGKTASFTLPMITALAKGRARARMPRSLVLAPTRELAAQVAENFEIYSKHTRLTMALTKVEPGPPHLVGCPGQLEARKPHVAEVAHEGADPVELMRQRLVAGGISTNSGNLC